jgi:hypothetical protein
MSVLPEPRVIESPNGMILTGDRQARGSWVGVGVRVGVDVWVGVDVLEGTGVKVEVTGRLVAEAAGAVPVGSVPVWSGCPGPPLAMYGKNINPEDEASPSVRLFTFSRTG